MEFRQNNPGCNAADVRNAFHKKTGNYLSALDAANARRYCRIHFLPTWEAVWQDPPKRIAAQPAKSPGPEPQEYVPTLQEIEAGKEQLRHQWAEDMGATIDEGRMVAQ